MIGTGRGTPGNWLSSAAATAAGNHASDSDEEGAGQEEPQAGDAAWETVCTTLEDFQRFVARLSASQNSYERSMHDFLATSRCRAWAAAA